MNIKNLIATCIYANKESMFSPNNKEKIKEKGKKIITRHRKNMKKAELTERENEILKKRTYIESCGNILKSKLSLEHTRHRSVAGYFMHVFLVIAVYVFYKQNTFVTLFF